MRKGKSRAEPAPPWWVHASQGAWEGTQYTWKRQEFPPGVLPGLWCARACSGPGARQARGCDALVSTQTGLISLLIQNNCCFPSLLLTYRIPVLASVVLGQGQVPHPPRGWGQSAHYLWGQGCAGVPSVGPGMLIQTPAEGTLSSSG